VGFLQAADAVAQMIPVEDFFVDVGELDAAGEFREVGVALDEGLRVEDDGVFEVLLGDFGADGAAEFAFDLDFGHGFGFLAEARALGAVKDVVLGGLVVALAHEFLLDHVLDVFDVDEGLVATADALGDAAGDVDGGFGVLFDGEEGFANGDLNFGLRPWDNVAIAADQGGRGSDC
jgi:hypothetical protein